MKPLFYYRIKDKFLNVGAKWDKLAPTKEDAIEFAHKYINPEPQRYKEGQVFSWEYYLAHNGGSINDRFRQDRPDKQDLDTVDMVAKNTTKIPIVVYRGVGEPVFKMMIKNAKNVDNVDLLEKSFLQTSLVKGCESTAHHHLRIYVPEGTQAVYLGNVNDEQFYYEVDIQHGAKMKIVSMDDKYINCEII